MRADRRPDRESGSYRVNAGDRVCDPAGDLYQVLDVDRPGGKVLLADDGGGLWVIKRRRLDKNWSLIPREWQRSVGGRHAG